MVESRVHLLIDLMVCEEDAFIHTTEDTLSAHCCLPPKFLACKNFYRFISLPTSWQVLAATMTNSHLRAPFQTYLSKYSLAQLERNIALGLWRASFSVPNQSISGLKYGDRQMEGKRDEQVRQSGRERGKGPRTSCWKKDAPSAADRNLPRRPTFSRYHTDNHQC